MSIRGKLLLSIGVLAIGYILFLSMVEITTSSTQKHMSIASEFLFPAASDIQAAQASFQKLNKAYKDAVMQQDASVLNASDAEARAGEDTLKEASEKLAYDPSLQQSAATLLDTFTQLHVRAKATYSKMLSTTNMSTQDQGDLTAVEQESKHLENALQELHETVGNKNYKAELDAVTASNNQQKFLGFLLFLLASAFAVVSVLILEKQVSKPLRDLVNRLSDGALRIAASATEVSSSSQSVSEDASHHAASLEETSAASEEIKAMAQSNTDGCRSAANLMSMSQEKFTHTNRSLSDLVLAMEEIKSSSGKISRIIKVIDEIAFQTNILALNAAVEAARAGEAGNGFAVVADEVRTLAQRSAQAARDTAELIGDSILKSNSGKTKVDEVSAAIQAVTDESSRVKLLVDQISLGSVEQTHGISNIARAISQMEQLTQTSAASAQQSAKAAGELTDQSESLEDIVKILSTVVNGNESDTSSRNSFIRRAGRTATTFAS
ncbi:methyl-accepting chemotaxis protein [Granulicella aggregans]|jgi:methyl-accepting chemotaxis protein|uniref:methyl-accepting chemotaxis protein n=1 Tax=Granulicella aggregans TaxID=474949 RepID=UPI0021DF4DCE|nr:methyl-accepting chemotaxis protein [Granulicella aggregans]